MTDAPKKRDKDAWIPWAFVGFFVLLTGLLAHFVYLSVSTFPGLVTEVPYRPGITADAASAAAEAQAALGWTLAVSYNGDAQEANPILVTLLDKDDAAITTATVHVLAERSTRNAQAIPLFLSHQGAGRYGGDLTLPLGGRWTLKVTAVDGENTFQKVVPVELAPGARS
ncbi:MAG: FixH family protein [Devosia sp.]